MQQRILIVLTNSAFQGASITNDTGEPQPLDLSALAAIAPEINAAAITLTESLAAEHAEALAAKESELANLQAAFDQFRKDAAASEESELAELAAKQDSIIAQLHQELTQATAERDGVYQFRDALLAKLEATRGDPEKVAAVASEAVGTLEEKRKQEAIARVAALREQAAALEAEIGIKA